MDNALWNGQPVAASEISESYIREKEIRMASGHKQLSCPDPDCQNPILRYCHGEMKDAFFAHLNNEHCDYARFDNENTQLMRSIRRTLYGLFKSKGFNIRTEVKVLDHHYTHLLFEMDNKRIAVEIGTHRITANRIDKLNEEYCKSGIEVKWIVIGDTNKTVHENQTYFLKRYLLNESKNKDLLVISWDGTEIAQYKVDPNRYEYKDNPWITDKFQDTYFEYVPTTELIFDGNELTIYGFKNRYLSWIDQKRKAFEMAVEQLKEDESRKQEELQRRLQEQKKFQQQQFLQRKLQSAQSIVGQNNKLKSERVAVKSSLIDMTYDQCKQEVLLKIEQQNEEAYDSMGNRWIKCETCGRVDKSDNFCYYGGQNQVNLGLCYDCRRKK